MYKFACQKDGGLHGKMMMCASLCTLISLERNAAVTYISALSALML